MKARLRPRDRLILSRLYAGRDAKQIAGELEISDNTAHTHIRQLCHKLGVVDARQLLLFVMQQPAAMRPGSECVRGIHSPSPDCACPYCRAISPLAA